MAKAMEALGMIETKGLISLIEACDRSEEHTSELQSRRNLVCRLLLEKKKNKREKNKKKKKNLCLHYADDCTASTT